MGIFAHFVALGTPHAFGGDTTEVPGGLVTSRGRDWSEGIAWDL